MAEVENRSEVVAVINKIADKEIIQLEILEKKHSVSVTWSWRVKVTCSVRIIWNSFTRIVYCVKTKKTQVN